MAKIIIKNNNGKTEIGGSKKLKLSKRLAKLTKEKRVLFILSLLTILDYFENVENIVTVNKKGLKVKIEGPRKELSYFLKFVEKAVKEKTEIRKDTIEGFCLDREI